jgi:AbrB family looped-hinge helix DNA binding protein
MTTTTTVKGQVVIPAALRRKFGIKPGTKVHFYEEKGRIILEPVNGQFLDKVCGMLEGSGAMKVLMEERRRERDE